MQVCDMCHSRKVRCDRKSPCGNCQDQGTACTRTRSMRRTPRKTSRANGRRSNASQLTRACPRPLSELGSFDGLYDQSNNSFVVNALPLARDTDTTPAEAPEGNFVRTEHSPYELYGWISIVPLTDAQMMSTHQLDRLHGLAWNRRQALESALCIAGRVTENMCGTVPNTDIFDNEHSRIPSAELLTWMLKDIDADRFGSYVLDYFQHVSKPTLKHMGLSLLQKDASPQDTVLYTVCVNAMAFKFLTTVLMTDNLGELAKGLWQSALQYRATAQAALKSIPLVTTPTLALLQAILCGIFLFQGSGDTTFCWELTRTACRVCTDIGLNAASLSGRANSSEEYYCFMWCYVLDRNYAWKLGRSKCFLETTSTEVLQSIERLNPSISDLLSIYLDLAHIQDGIIPFLKDNHTVNMEHTATPSSNLKERLLPRMESIRARIDQITSTSDKWKGLNPRSEVAALDFAFHSVMTTILQLIQLTADQTTSTKDRYLESARQELSALVSICLSADKQSTVAFLHWTLLYYPLTAAFVLFCNAVVTSHIGDFNLLKMVASCLAQSGPNSQHIYQLQKLFQEFISLSQNFLEEESTLLSANHDVVQKESSRPQEAPSADIGRNHNMSCWNNNGLALSPDILTGWDDPAFDSTFPLMGLSYADPTFILSSNPGTQ
ncbi:hypothetical protein BDV25DRAFT_148449 [Aspergillus avenaceus]|uniref:Zn(2)-C6 fungal-type domain-containing protein n=1 Tax=Aspergillus avenaceus TaxID=36643 RepID=A0A5N6U6E1_ASPAV|nr:hypothetical protein BDV25DRAFT_148449 [Aspergillus avenaceus]